MKLRRPHRASALFAAPLALLLVASLPAATAHADDEPDLDDFSFDSLDAQYTLARGADGRSMLEVSEHFVAVFPEFDQNRGMRRGVPLADGDQPHRPELRSISDESGALRPAETDTVDDEFVMTSRADDYVHGAQHYIFDYGLENVIRASDAGQELYWNVVGVEHAQPYGQVRVRVSMDAEVAAALTGEAACYAGAKGTGGEAATGRCEITREGDSFIATTGSLAPDEAMTIAIGFDAGTFARFNASPFATPLGWLQALGLVIAGAGVTLAGWVRARRLRDAPGRPTIIAEYAPPPGLDALHSAVLLGEPAKGVPAEVLEQAIVGSLRIIEGEKSFWGGTRLEAEFITSEHADDDGRMLLQALFGDAPAPGARYRFGSSDTRFSKAAQAMLSQASNDLRSRGLRRSGSRRDYTVAPLIAGVGAVMAVAFGILSLVFDAYPVFPLLGLVGAGLSFAFAIGMVARRPLTAAGAEARDHLAGLREFIEWAEEDRIRMLQGPSTAERVDTGDAGQMLRLYERLLPFAVVFGQEKEWAERLAVYYNDSSPGWYSGGSGFNVVAFAAGMSSLSASSSAGAASGGGSAGGGGGGGSTGGV